VFNASMPMIQIRDLTKTYGKTMAVRGLTFEVPKGQVVGFLGPNGAGKSTTMKILTGYLEATSGSAMIGGIDVAAHPVEARKLLGYLPEDNPLYDDMMVVEYLRYMADLRKIPHASQAPMIANAVRRCGLDSVMGRDVGALSKGYRQRVGLAQAILHDPPLLILDEPTSGLDPNQIVEIRALIKELGREKTILMSTHILPEVQTTCSRVLIINDGKLVADDTPENLVMQDGGAIRVVVAVQGDEGPIEVADVFRLLESIRGVTRVEEADGEYDGGHAFTLRYEREDPRPALFRQVSAARWILLEMHRKEMSLEDTFRRLTME